jgi:hypothetical protein
LLDKIIGNLVVSSEMEQRAYPNATVTHREQYGTRRGRRTRLL